MKCAPRPFFIKAIAPLLLMAAAAPAPAQPVPVKLDRTESGARLSRGGKPYFIKGAGGQSYADLLAASGGNSLRTWGADNLGPILDRARESGLSVAVGIWLGQERQGFRYSDPNQVQGDFDRAREAIRRYRDHPAVLLWGLGNEMEGDGSNPAVWKAVDAIARMAKQEDPNHPTMTVIAGADPRKLSAFMKYCTHVDILGINIYGGLSGLGDALRKSGLKKPFIVTEFGPRGHWESPKTSWGAAIEPSSTEKAKHYALSYRKAIGSGSAWCVGAYAFLWGQKQEVTATWYGMFLNSGERLGAVDAMTEAWMGKPPVNRCPEIAGLKVDWGDPGVIAPAARFRARLSAADPEGDPLALRWEIRSESVDRHEGGDRESEPSAHPECRINAKGVECEFSSPSRAGAYRLFVFVYDGQGNAATMNLPFRVVD